MLLYMIDLPAWSSQPNWNTNNLSFSLFSRARMILRSDEEEITLTNNKAA